MGALDWNSIPECTERMDQVDLVSEERDMNVGGTMWTKPGTVGMQKAMGGWNPINIPVGAMPDPQPGGETRGQEDAAADMRMRGM